MKVTILGCGGSGGVPLIGDVWGACNPANPRNRRRRPSVLVEWRNKSILIDTTPDLRDQLLDARARRIDAILYTHAHADHVHGIDDLRSVVRLMGKGTTIDVYAEPSVIDQLMTRFGYLFVGGAPLDALYRPILVPHRVSGRFSAAGLDVVGFGQDHGIGPSTGFRLGNFAYSTDVVKLPEESFSVLAGVELWVVDCLRIENAHPTHAHLAVTLDWINRVRPKRAILTHMNHQADYDELARALPPGVEAGYDGLTVELGE